MSHPILFFDGPCHLCQRSVQFILEHERTDKLRFCSLQSAAAKELLKNCSAFRQTTSLPAEKASAFKSLILLEEDKCHQRSDAALRLAGYLRFPWCLLQIFWLLPRPLRDGLYDFIAKRRYRWFGKDEAESLQCPAPLTHWKKRFL